MRKPVSLRSLASLGAFLLICSFSGLVLATPAEEAQLEQLDKIEQELELQRDWAKYRWDKTNSECYQNFWVNSCLKDSRADYRKEIGQNDEYKACKQIFFILEQVRFKAEEVFHPS